MLRLRGTQWRAINYRTEDFVEVINQFTSGKGVDVILDTVAGDHVQRELKCLAFDGRLSIQKLHSRSVETKCLAVD